MSGLPDTTDVKSSGDFPPIIADWYEMIFKDFESKTDKNNNPFTKIELGFADSERLAWTNLTYNEDFLWVIKQFKEAIGMPDKESDLMPYKGSRLMVFVKNRVYEGDNYADPRKFKPMDGVTPKAEPPTDGAPPPDDDDLPF